MKRVFIQNHKPLNFKFYQNTDDFKVEEKPLSFRGKGNFIILKIRKKSLGTWDLIEKLAKLLNIYENEIGYAGLKDKNATTTQYISIPRKYLKELKKIKHNKIEILETTFHGTKLNIGDLAGNAFEINLHDVKAQDVGQIEKRLKEIAQTGMPNFFGYQRFGRDIEENLNKARKIIYGELKIRDRKLEKMLISAYQSDFFNRWLAARIKASAQKFELLNGDVMIQLKDEKLFTPTAITDALNKDFVNQKVVPTGLLSGRNVFRAKYEARDIEEKFDDTYIQEKGLRRPAIVYPKDISVQYHPQSQKCKLKFMLPRGAYATVLIENIANRNLKG